MRERESERELDTGSHGRGQTEVLGSAGDMYAYRKRSLSLSLSLNRMDGWTEGDENRGKDKAAFASAIVYRWTTFFSFYLSFALLPAQIM